VGLGANLPFITQAFHIDDRVNIYTARQVLVSPLDPYGFAMVFAGRLQKAHEFDASPPLDGYLLALPLIIVGESEVGLHGAYTAFAFLAGLFMYLLGRRFSLTEGEALSAAAILVLSPGVFTMAHTVMPDVALLSFYTAAVYFFVGGVDTRSIRDYTLAGLFAAAACLTRYSGLTLVPPFVGWALLKDGSVRPRAWVSLLLPLLATSLWLAWAAVLYGGSWWSNIVSLEVGGSGLWKFLMQIAAGLAHLGGAAIFPPALLLVLKSVPPKVRTLLVGVAAAISLVLAGELAQKFDHIPGQVALFLVFGVCILSFLGVLISRAPAWFRAEPGRLFLTGWILFLVVFNASFLHTAVKYNILEMPALVISFVLLLREAFEHTYRRYLAATVVLTGILGLTTAVADWRLANMYRTFAASASAHARKGNRVFYTGDWGWDYYMHEQGARPIISAGTPEIGRGDVILSPTMAWPQPLPAALAGKLILRGAIEAADRFPVRTMNGPGKAFFYANVVPGSVGVLPWSFSTAPLETFLTFEVQ
jgi:4-amino-4-deoxy-L-arabinose transferase-like glycosyltransferase